nr:RNA-directed DNA polymerase, eukaryota [Tanacetum cinerariifolium]
MGVFKRMESMHRHFFNGVDNNDRKLTMIRINLHAFVKKKVGDGEQTLFWEDSWLSEPPLKNIFPWLYALETNKHASVAAKFRDTSMSAFFRRVPRGGLEEDQFQLLVDKIAYVILFSIKDRWVWILDSGGEFSVKSACLYIDDYLLLIVGPPTRWVINLHACVKKKVGDGEQTLFWKDSWLFDPHLKNIFPRVYALETKKHASVATKFRDTSMSASFRRVLRGGLEEDQFQLFVDKVASVILFCIKDRWVWILDSGGELSVKSARLYIDDYLLSIVGPPTRWVNVIPIKINIFTWRISLDRLPSRFNLSFRGIDVSSILCPICSSAGETSSHLLFSCNVARQLLFKVARLWELDIQDFHSYVDWLSWFNGLRLSKGHKSVLE